MLGEVKLLKLLFSLTSEAALANEDKNDGGGTEKSIVPGFGRGVCPFGNALELLIAAGLVFDEFLH